MFSFISPNLHPFSLYRRTLGGFGHQVGVDGIVIYSPVFAGCMRPPPWIFRLITQYPWRYHSDIHPSYERFHKHSVLFEKNPRLTPQQKRSSSRPSLLLSHCLQSSPIHTSNIIPTNSPSTRLHPIKVSLSRNIYLASNAPPPQPQSLSHTALHAIESPIFPPCEKAPLHSTHSTPRTPA